jgi:hypothetical protein
MVVSIEIKIRHQISLHIIYGLSKCLEKFIEGFFVKEYFMLFRPILIETFTAFRNREVVIIATGCSNVKEVSPSFSSSDTLALNDFHSFVVVFVRHSCKFSFSQLTN